MKMLSVEQLNAIDDYYYSAFNEQQIKAISIEKLRKIGKFLSVKVEWLLIQIIWRVDYSSGRYIIRKPKYWIKFLGTKRYRTRVFQI